MSESGSAVPDAAPGGSAGTRRASCTCGAVAIETRGDPPFVAICACRNCQSRTGSAFGVSAYFADDQVRHTRGVPSVFRGLSRKGRRLDYRFCPTCGTTVWWRAKFRPGSVGVAAGLFDDLPFITSAAYFVETKPGWVRFDPDIAEYPAGSGRWGGRRSMPVPAGRWRRERDSNP